MDVSEEVEREGNLVSVNAGAASTRPRVAFHVAKLAAAGHAVDEATLDALGEARVERVDSSVAGQELVSALANASSPRRYFDVLRSAGLLDDAYPAVGALDGVPAGPEGTHEEGDSLEHTLLVLEAMFERVGNDVPGLLAALAHDLGKGVTDESTLPSHTRHEKRGETVARRMARRLNLTEYADVMALAARQHMRLHRIRQLNASTVIDIAEAVSATDFDAERLVAVGVADSNGREPKRPFYEEDAIRKIGVAVDVVGEVDEEYALSRRGMDAEETSSEKCQNMVRQDRVETYRERL